VHPQSSGGGYTACQTQAVRVCVCVCVCVWPHLSITLGYPPPICPPWHTPAVFPRSRASHCAHRPLEPIIALRKLLFLKPKAKGQRLKEAQQEATGHFQISDMDTSGEALKIHPAPPGMPFGVHIDVITSMANLEGFVLPPRYPRPPGAPPW
jgi:hypothetical protein